MKNLLKTLALMGLLVAPAFADSVQDLWSRELGAIKSFEIVAGSSTIALRLGYTGTQTSAVVTLLNSVMTFQAPSGTNDTSIGNNGVLTLTGSTVNTLGQLCSVIDANANYSCILKAAKKNDTSQLLRNTPQTSLLVPDGLAVYTSTSYFEGIGIIPSPGRYVRLKKCSWQSTAVENFAVFGKLRRDARPGVSSEDDTTLALKLSNTPNLLTVTNFVQVVAGSAAIVGATVVPAPALPDGAIDFDIDAHVVIRNSTGSNSGSGTAQNGDEVTPSTLSFLACSWEER